MIYSRRVLYHFIFSMKALFTTRPSLGLTVLRLAIAAVMIYHGGQKLGYFGGFGLEGTLGFFSGMGVPAFITYLVIVGEFVGGIAMVLGFFTRFTAASWVVIMIGAIYIVHWAQIPEQGFKAVEFQILLLAASLTLLCEGAGCLSIDRFLGKKDCENCKSEEKK